MTKKKRFGLTARLNFLTISLILGTAMGIVFFTIRQEEKRIYQQLVNHGRSVATMVSQNSEYGIYTENKASLLHIIDSLAVDPDIAYISILNLEKRQLAYRSFKPSVEIPAGFHDNEFKPVKETVIENFVNSKDKRHYIDLLTPVVSLTSKEIVETDFAEKNDRNIENRTMIIGYVRLGLTQERIRKEIRQFIFPTVVVTVLFVLVGISLTLFMTRRILSPIKKLAGVARDVAEEKLDNRVRIKTSDEIADLGNAFNDMLDRLQAYRNTEKEYQQNLEEKVEQRTLELSRAKEKAYALVDQLREAQEQLVRKERLAVLGQLAGGLGHELRNPMGVIKNTVYFLNMILEKPGPQVKESLEILGKEVENSERIITSLLDFARSRPPQRQEVDMNEILRGVLAGINTPGNIQVVNQDAESLPLIMADPDQLAQIYGNMIRNAVQAMPEGGRLIIKSESSDPGWVTVSIADTGVGIPEENLAKIFEPLFTTKAKGIGLGMALIKTLVRGHGGSVEVQSEVGKGSTFTVKLPARKKEEGGKPV
jgi:signal transduction histidine kinase